MQLSSLFSTYLRPSNKEITTKPYKEKRRIGQRKPVKVTANIAKHSPTCDYVSKRNITRITQV